MTRIYVTGIGAVSPAGWGIPPLLAALDGGTPIPTRALPGSWGHPPRSARLVPNPTVRPAVLAHPRLRRASAISQYAAAAAMEALGLPGSGVPSDLDPSRLGIIVGVHTGSMRYSIRFYGEVLRDPSTASPVLFPETVFNAPASHIAAFLNGTPRTYTLVGDQTVFLQALATGAHWLADGRVDRCLVVSAEESDWLMATALGLFAKGLVHSEGAGAVCLARTPQVDAVHGVTVELDRITSMQLYARHATRHSAAIAMREELPPDDPTELLCDSQTGVLAVDDAECQAWTSWSGLRQSVKPIVGEALSAAAAWQSLQAIHAIRSRTVTAANVSVVGSNEAAVGARWVAAS